MRVLQLASVKVEFGGLVAVDDLSFSVRQGTIHSLIGPNGAGKTTVINTITGLYRPSHGEIRVAHTDISQSRPDEICRLGVARTFQNTQLFGEMTALENVVIGADIHARYGIFESITRLPRYRRGERRSVHRALELLDMVGLRADAFVNAAALPFGKQRQLELARALASNPKLLLLDEPAAGLRSAEIDSLNEMLLKLRDERGITILLVDHVMKVVMRISDRITVLNFGHKIAEGTPIEVRGDPEVTRAYLGSKVNRARTSQH
ncbi:MAG: ABC transporter ATP-binding protein [Terriglobales bacterium]